ncbi:MAG: hypothetical protein K0R61_63 [Microvirga sp.]|jgi:hypothetical protein|nr:hypothetical protein [Microvirga sp.]MDF2969613.1 hypothetical protein [Microvirga sp.]
MAIGTSAAILGGLSVAGSIGGGLLSASGAQAGGAAAAQAAQNAATTNANISRDQRMENRVDASPYMAAGRGGLNELGRLFGWGSLETNGGHDQWRFSTDPYGGSQGSPGGPSGTPDASRLNALANTVPRPNFSANLPTFDRLNFSKTFEADPGYAFRQAEGSKALERSALSRGKALSGEQGKALEDFNSGLASQEYGNWWNRYTGGTQFNNAATQQEFGNKLQAGQQDYTNAYGATRDVMSDWMALAGLGQGSTNSMAGMNSSLAGQTGNAFVNAGIAGGQAQGAGIANGANALASGIGSGINNALTAAYLGGAFRGGGASIYGTPNPNLGSVGGQPMSYYR